MALAWWLLLGVAGLVVGALLSRRWWGWLVILLIGAAPVLVGMRYPMEGTSGLGTGLILAVPYLIAVPVGWWVRALAQAYLEERAEGSS